MVGLKLEFQLLLLVCNLFSKTIASVRHPRCPPAVSRHDSTFNIYRKRPFGKKGMTSAPMILASSFKPNGIFRLITVVSS